VHNNRHTSSELPCAPLAHSNGCKGLACPLPCITDDMRQCLTNFCSSVPAAGSRGGSIGGVITQMARVILVQSGCLTTIPSGMCLEEALEMEPAELRAMQLEDAGLDSE